MMVFNKLRYYINLLKKNKYSIYAFVLSIAVIFFNVFFRIGNNKEGYSLLSLKGNIIFQIISILFLITHMYILCNTFHAILKKNSAESKLTIYIRTWLYKIYWQPLNIFYDYIAPKIPYSGTIILYVINIVENKPIWTKFMPYSDIFFVYLPKIFVVCIFFLDIVLLKEIHYFPFVIIVLLLPLIYKIFLKLANDFAIRNAPEFEEYVEITPRGSPNAHGIFLEYEFKMKKNYKHNQEALEEASYYLMLFFRLRNYVFYLKKRKNQKFI